ncbi:MAG TPA: hypothetical protein DC017_05970 [Candidatus Wallbacteria bacterium]|nr:hypothetical protein [Candidatus Wallbacteria bacterium]
MSAFAPLNSSATSAVEEGSALSPASAGVPLSPASAHEMINERHEAAMRKHTADFKFLTTSAVI